MREWCDGTETWHHRECVRLIVQMATQGKFTRCVNRVWSREAESGWMLMGARRAMGAHCLAKGPETKKP